MKQLLTVLILTLAATAFGQNQTPVEYLNRVSAPLDSVRQNCWDYMSAVIYGKNAANLSGLRSRWTNGVTSSIASVSALPAYDGDVAFRDSVLNYLHYINRIITNDLTLLDQLKAEATISFEAADKYYNEVNSLNAIFQKSADKIKVEQRKFADRNSIVLSDNDRANIAEKLKNAIKLNRHYNTNYMAVLNLQKEEEAMLAAFDKNDLVAAASTRNNIEKHANESLAKLSTLVPFNKDASLIAAARAAINFYLLEARDNVPALLDYFDKSAKFDKAKVLFTEQQSRGATPQQSETYNKAVQEINAAGTLYNTTIESLNEKRRLTTENWEKASKTFLANNNPPK